LTEFKADFSGQRLRISEKFLGYLGLKLMNTVPGQLDFSGKIEGNLNRIQGKGSATAKNWSYQGKAIRTAGIDWYLTDDHWLELQAELDSNIGQADAMVKIGLPQSEKGRCIIDGNLSSVALQSLKPFIDSPVSGKCSGPFKIDFNFFNPATATYDLLLEMREGEFYSFRPELVTARVYGTGADWNLEDPVAEFYEGGNIVVDGILSAKKLDAKVKVEDVALSTFGVSSEIASGNASLIAEVKGSIQQPELVGDLYGSNLYLMGQKVNSFKSRLSLKDKKLDLSPLVLVPFDEGMIDGFYSLDLETGKTRSLKFNFQRLSLEFIKSLLPDNYSTYGLTGRIAGSVSFDGQKEQNYWDFFVDGRRLNLFDHDIDTLFLEGSVYGNQGEIRNLFVRAFGGKFNLSGQVLGSDKFDGMIEAESIYLDRISILKEFVPGVRGEINFQGNIEWEGPEKTGYFTLFGDRIKVQDRDLGNLGAEIVIDNEGMRIVKAEFDKLGVYLDGNIDWKGRKPYQADLKLTNVDLSFLTKAHGIKTFEYGGLTVDGQCSMAGDLASLTPDVVEMQLDSIKIQKENDVIVSNKPMQLKYQNNNLEVRSLELKYRQGILGIEGIHKPGEETALMLNGTDFSIKALGRLLDLPEWDYDGRLSANASVFGNYPDLKVRADARIDEFDIADRKISGVTAKISGDTRILNLEEFKVQLPASSFELKGKVGIKDLQEIDNIDLLLAIPKGPISDLPTLMPSIFRQASGTIAADLSLKGDPNSPQLEGELALSADELGISGMRKPFKDVRFEVSTEDSIINIDELQGKLGAGKILGEGQINFRDGPGSITARISGEKIDFSFLNFEINKASATFDVGGNLYNPEIMGKVHVPRGKFFINTDLLKDRPGLNLFLNSLKYNIDVEVPRNFWLKSSFLNAEMRGKFSIMGDLDQVKLDGGISCVQGWLYFQKRKFRIDTGKVRFGGVEDAFDPHIFIKSEGRVQNTQVYLTLQGRVSSFTPKIYSSPPMSEGDLLALLTLGRDMTSAMQSDSKELFENEILDGLKNSYISALIGNTISTALNLDELFLTSLYDKTEGRSRSFIRAGKYIGNNIFMAYEGTLDERDEETFIFEYRLPKGFVVNLEFEEPEKDKRIGVRYDWKFW
ncbi:MAG: translocation and assembly module TamB, partial [Clostridiales bacterium]|nr:translocation and assembly module TamB [Clostridiales bacterium]MDN5282658.1 translocation and assembly module TamB [Candidatus Ozemobacter sp.]